MHNEVKDKVFELLVKDKSGHGIDHVSRVHNLSLKFAKQENANNRTVSLTALLHDVDDYKLVGKKSAEQLFHAKDIMKKCGIDSNTQNDVLENIRRMGFSKYLKGIRPETLEGKIVSDADMCDGMGASGIIRSIVYSVSDKGNGVIFDRNIFPNIDITAEEYNVKGTVHDTDNAINYFFEKLLKLKDIMLTKSGRKEGEKRQKIMIDFLRNFFEEENVDEKWFNLVKDLK